MTLLRLLLVNFIVRLCAAGSGQLFAFLVADRLSARLGLGSAVVGMIGASYFLTELSCAPFAGHFADKHGQIPVLRAGPIFGGVCGAIAALTAAWSLGPLALVGVLFFARAIEGLSAACAVPTTLVLLSRMTAGDVHHRVRSMGLFEITSMVGLISGYAGAGVGWDALGARAFLLLPVLYAVAWLLIGSGSEQPEPSRSSPEIWTVLRVLATDRNNVSFAVAWLAVNAVVGVWLQQAPYLLRAETRSTTQTLVGGYTGTTIGIIFGSWGVVFLGGIAAWSILGARIPKRTVLTLSLLAMFGVVFTLFAVNHGAPPALLALTIAFILIESGFTPVALAHLADITELHDTSRGAAVGLYSLVLGMGQLLGNVLGTPFAATWQMDGILAVTFGLAVIALAGVWFMRGSATSP